MQFTPKFSVNLNLSDACVSCDRQLSFQAGHDYTLIRIYKQFIIRGKILEQRCKTRKLKKKAKDVAGFSARGSDLF